MCAFAALLENKMIHQIDWGKNKNREIVFFINLQAGLSIALL